uniref:Uncharacterized protein n=2 Tax=Globodera rostochiensis TaxID=31243 RepID=A0A914H7C6_GLORO
MKSRVTARQQRACGDGASSGAKRRAKESLTSASGVRARGDPRNGRARGPQPGVDGLSMHWLTTFYCRLVCSRRMPSGARAFLITNEQQFDDNEQQFDDNEQQFDDNEQQFDDNKQQFDDNEQQFDDNKQQFNDNEQYERHQFDDKCQRCAGMEWTIEQQRKEYMIEEGKRCSAEFMEKAMRQQLEDLRDDYYKLEKKAQVGGAVPSIWNHLCWLCTPEFQRRACRCAGDTIACHLDRKTHTVSYFLNETQIDYRDQRVPATSALHPAVTLRSTGDKVEIRMGDLPRPNEIWS